MTVAYFALMPADAPVRTQGGSDARQARWFAIDELPELAFDHSRIVEYALSRLRYKLEYSAAGFQLLPEEFTLSQLQHTYELILGEKLDKRNFRRRILEANIIEETPHMRSGEGRPAGACIVTAPMQSQKLRPAVCFLSACCPYQTGMKTRRLSCERRPSYFLRPVARPIKVPTMPCVAKF